MIRTTPFHERLSGLNTQGLYTHWQGHLSPLRYTHAPKHEYFAVRNSVGVFDTSPLYKYRVSGPDAEALLAGIMVRDIRSCRPGKAQYTLWCDERGFVMEDGVVFRHSADDFLVTAARPNLGWFTDHRGSLRATVEDVSDGPVLDLYTGNLVRFVEGKAVVVEWAQNLPLPGPGDPPVYSVSELLSNDTAG